MTSLQPLAYVAPKKPRLSPKGSPSDWSRLLNPLAFVLRVDVTMKDTEMVADGAERQTVKRSWRDLRLYSSSSSSSVFSSSFYFRVELRRLNREKEVEEEFPERFTGELLMCLRVSDLWGCCTLALLITIRNSIEKNVHLQFVSLHVAWPVSHQDGLYRKVVLCVIQLTANVVVNLHLRRRLHLTPWEMVTKFKGVLGVGKQFFKTQCTPIYTLVRQVLMEVPR